VHAGDPAQNLVQLAHAEAVDLIVMPTHGHGPIRRSILGSVAAKVLHGSLRAHAYSIIRHSPCPVVSI
jgi:nucleotide-binding universal stress UspA family protein